MKTPQNLLFGVGVFLAASGCSSTADPAAEARSWTVLGGEVTCLTESGEAGEPQLTDCVFVPDGSGSGSGTAAGSGTVSASGSGSGTVSADGSGSGGVGVGHASGSGTGHGSGTGADE